MTRPMPPKEAIGRIVQGNLGIGEHHRARGGTNEWLTPPEILNALGPFDLDPCAPILRPWDMAARHYTIEEDGLLQDWSGNVWLNPPYGPETSAWLSRLADHRNGIALVFARTETRWFHRYGWNQAGAMLFIRGRLNFHHSNGYRSAKNAGAPSVLIAYGKENCRRLRKSGLPGKLIELEGVK